MLQVAGSRCQLFSPPPFAGGGFHSAVSGPGGLAELGGRGYSVITRSLQRGFLSISCWVVSKGGVRKEENLGGFALLSVSKSS